MNLNLARRIDFWIGIPASLITSIFYKVEKLFCFKKPAEEADPRKILFLELSEMGSAILAHSAIIKAKEIYPESRLYFWIFKENAESVTIPGIIPAENIIRIDSRNLLVLFIDTMTALWRIRSEKIDVIIDLELFSRFTSILSYLSRAKKRVGFYRFSMEGLFRADVYTHKVIYNPYMHISRNFLSLVYSLKEPENEIPFLKKAVIDEITGAPKKLLNDEQKDRVWSKLKAINKKVSKTSRLIILNFGTGEHLPLRNWPLENYSQLAEKLLKEENVFIILIGIKYDSGQKEQVKHLLSHERCIDLIGKASVNEVMDFCSISRLLISHDSGVANLASLTLINSIVLFGPETPALYAPLNSNITIIYKHFACSPCFSAYNHRNSVCRNNLCLKVITADEVHESAKKHL